MINRLVFLCYSPHAYVFLVYFHLYDYFKVRVFLLKIAAGYEVLYHAEVGRNSESPQIMTEIGSLKL
jgi:hypothetical protein